MFNPITDPQSVMQRILVRLARRLAELPPNAPLVARVQVCRLARDEIRHTFGVFDSAIWDEINALTMDCWATLRTGRPIRLSQGGITWPGDHAVARIIACVEHARAVAAGMDSPTPSRP